MSALDLVLVTGIINISLNVLGAIKRIGHFERFDAPFDCGLRLGGERLLGASTTWLGLVLALGLGYVFQETYAPFGIVLGLGTFFGHAISSFIKRRLHYPDGAYMPLVGHGDYVLLSGVILVLAGNLTGLAYVEAIALTLAIHPLFCFVGYKIGLRQGLL